MACDFIHVGSGAVACTENFSGVGRELYVFNMDGVEAKPVYDEAAAQYTSDSFANVPMYKVALKKQTGKVTCTNNPNGGGFSNVFTGMVANDMENMALLARTMNNHENWGAMVSAGQGKFYVLYDPDFGVTFGLEGDTGDTPDSDHGYTLTITCSPMLYPHTKWEGTPTVATDSAEG